MRTCIALQAQERGPTHQHRWERRHHALRKTSSTLGSHAARTHAWPPSPRPGTLSTPSGTVTTTADALSSTPPSVTTVTAAASGSAAPAPAAAAGAPPPAVLAAAATAAVAPSGPAAGAGGGGAGTAGPYRTSRTGQRYIMGRPRHSAWTTRELPPGQPGGGVRWRPAHRGWPGTRGMCVCVHICVCDGGGGHTVSKRAQPREERPEEDAGQGSRAAARLDQQWPHSHSPVEQNSLRLAWCLLVPLSATATARQLHAHPATPASFHSTTITHTSLPASQPAGLPASLPARRPARRPASQPAPRSLTTPGNTCVNGQPTQPTTASTVNTRPPTLRQRVRPHQLVVVVLRPVCHGQLARARCIGKLQVGDVPVEQLLLPGAIGGTGMGTDGGATGRGGGQGG